jgi:hypothetical protein
LAKLSIIGINNVFIIYESGIIPCRYKQFKA